MRHPTSSFPHKDHGFEFPNTIHHMGPQNWPVLSTHDGPCNFQGSVVPSSLNKVCFTLSGVRARYRKGCLHVRMQQPEAVPQMCVPDSRGMGSRDGEGQGLQSIPLPKHVQTPRLGAWVSSVLQHTPTYCRCHVARTHAASSRRAGKHILSTIEALPLPPTTETPQRGGVRREVGLGNLRRSFM